MVIIITEVQGDFSGVKNSLIEKLKALYDLKAERGQFCPVEILDILASFTGITSREAMVYLDRSGRVLSVGVGERDRVSLPELSHRRSEERLSGIRCIHTHPGGNPRLSQVDIQTLKSIRLDAMAAVGVMDEKPVLMQVGILDFLLRENELSAVLYGPYKADSIPDGKLWEEIMAADECIRPGLSSQIRHEKEQVILIGIDDAKDDYDSLAELSRLSDTADLEVVKTVRQIREKPDSTLYLGYGKVQELSLQISALNADAVIFDDELSPAQIRNLGKELGNVKIIDRTLLILDIFSRRASTREGRLQVELAQIKYMLPRLTGHGTAMSRLGGGGGGGAGARRGVGETKLELDRRRLRQRMHELENEIKGIKAGRDLRRTARERTNIPVIALVGYTNAGKSTLLNKLSGSDVLAEDKLFATLDTVSRRVEFDCGEFLLVDTVGFINKLPHDLVDAFRATLEEVCYADLLLHIVDASSPERAQQAIVVKEVLERLGAGEKPMLTIYNKNDILPEPLLEGQDVSVSAVNGMGIEALIEAVSQKLAEMRTKISVILPHDSGALVSQIYERGQVISCEYLDDGIHVKAIVPPEDMSRLYAAAIK